jgi:hypothetical protein
VKRRSFGIAAVGISAVLLVGSAVAVAGPGQKSLVRGVHAEISLIKANGTTDAFVVDRGQVTAESVGSVTLLRKDGVSVTLGLSGATKVRGDIQVDKGAIVFSRGGTAFAVLAPRAAKAAPFSFGAGKGKGKGLGERLALLKARKGLMGAVHADVMFIKADGSTVSFSFDRGSVTAASGTSVTLKRADGPGVTKSISADTKLRGKLAVGGKAAVFSKGGAATAILAAGPKA